MTRVILVFAFLALAGAAWAQWNDDAQKCYEKEGGLDLVIHYCTRAIQSGELSDHSLAITFNNRGVKYRNKGKYDRAIRDFDQAIRLDPDNAGAFNNKAWLLATVRSSYIRDGIAAVRLAREAVRLKDHPSTRDTVAAAYAEAGRFADAVAEQERAIKMLRAAG